ncbi:TonB-linked SusC/RagA family outer membrane protein [Anseongella ginsenosidimutans]|uniref:TonB-linked SusC/RagA family outer membrane protein n=1 Tax=Anseongella ginsenosidimutans TaxID=496056 RepID=A0A4R3KQZ6_9SPHI|nr:SusC/RagA family TonB-linked outer membrane protein [Anseongella ginsenosidimutans]TCS86503.1 TonB-linked SusC/RagA family outer membrane protein [Anseongella ginsenosidimutans]
MIPHIVIKFRLCLMVALLCPAGSLLAQGMTDTLRGRVSDEWGNPLGGILVHSENGKNGSSTDLEGLFSIAINDGSSYLVFSGDGYLSQQVPLAQETDFQVEMQRDAHRKDEIVHLGYSSQRREALSGAVATVTGEELERSPVANLSQAFAGRLPGLFTQETFSELSRANTDLFVRGISAARATEPLVVIDGIVCSYQSNETLEYISANEIESISILKDAASQALYGIQGANGVIVITTKRGRKGKLQINGRLDQSMQEVTTQPTFYNSAEYAEMRNQAALNDGEALLFSAEDIAHYRNGDQPDLFPNNNWYNRYIKDFASMQRLGVNLNGGNDKVQFFSNVNFMHQGGQFNTEQTSYDPAPNNLWFNYRSNVDMNLNDYLRAFVRLSGNVKREHTAGVGNADIYGSIFQLPPTMYGPLTPEGQVVTTQLVGAPTYGMLNRTGYINHTVTNTTSQFGLDLNMDFLTKGLNLTGIFAYQTNSVGSLRTIQNYERWLRNDESEELAFIKKGDELNTPLAYTKGHLFYYRLTYRATLDYQRDFGKHNIGGMAYMFYQNLTKSNTNSPELLPYNRVSSGAEIRYGYDNRYFLKGDIGYSGSEQYARNTRYTTTPAVSAAWVISNEEFMQEAAWLSQLKLRAAWGKTANDQSGLGRYAYLDNVTVQGGGPIGYLQYLVNENQIGNPNIAAEVSTKQNLGLDIGLFNAVSLSVDVFKERMENMVVDAAGSIPQYQGVPLLNYPALNAGVFENKGYEITADFVKRLNRDLSIQLGGAFTYAKNTVISRGEALRTEDYAYRKWEEGYSFGQQFGYLVDYSNGNGFFNSAEELANSGLTYDFGDPRVGDLIYQDLNQDGSIDERDKAPVGHGAVPRIVYGFSGGLTYRAFDLNFLFQGLGQYETMLGGTGIWETAFDGVFGALHRNAWTAERYANGEAISWPALSLEKTVNHEMSDFVNYDRSYLRLKNLELGYTLPMQTAKAISAEKIRFVLSGQNLLTWDNMKSDDFGPEGAGYTSFPVYRVYSLGVNVIF